MRLIELFPEDDLLATKLAEGPIRDALKRTALGGAIAAGLGYGYGAMTTPPPQSISTSDQAALAKVLQQDPVDMDRSPGGTFKGQGDEDILGDFIRKGMKVDGSPEIKDGINDGFPKGLIGLDKVDPDTRVSEFIKHFMPYVEAENKRIANIRQRLISLVNKMAASRPISRHDREWVQSLYTKYGTDSIKELLNRIDIVPPSLAIAQAALESGWGTAELAQSHNVFYGQKSWSKTGGAEGQYGERYRAFDSPHMSVAAYMLNLNTHPAYQTFRDQRAKLRKSGEPLSGEDLAQTLGKYSTLGSTYTKRLLKMMRGRDLVSLDVRQPM